MAMATSEEDKVISNLRACLVSAPGGLLLSHLNKDYRSMVGEFIPFKKLGYPSLEDFIQLLPNVDITKKGGDWHIAAVASAGSSHISKLVQGQRKTSKRPRKVKRISHFKTDRSSSPSVHRSSNQIPHFMRGPNAGKSPQPKPRAQYIAPDKQPARPLLIQERRRPRQSRTEPSQIVLPEDLPVTIYEPSGNKSTPVTHHPPEPRTVEDQEPPSRNSQALEQTNTVQKAPRLTVAGQLKAYKNNTILSPISEVSMSNTLSTQNGNNSNNVAIPFDGSESIDSSRKPGNYSCEVKVVDPISWTKDKNKKQFESNSLLSKTFKSVDYHYEEQSYIDRLRRFADNQNWPQPDFFILNRYVGSSKYPELSFICRVSVNCTPKGSLQSSAGQAMPCQEFSSYPEEFSDVKSAMSCVAKKAYDALIENETIQLPETRDTQTILSRISEIVRGRDQGIWLYQVENIYKAQFNEGLPADLPSLLDQCPTLEITKLAESYYIVRPTQQEAGGKNLVVNKPIYPLDVTWDVFVSRVKSLNEIYIRIIGDQYSVVYERLAMEMDEYYLNGATAIPECIEVGKYYALLTQDSSYRVLVASINNNEYQVYLIDVGDVDFVKKETLRLLLPKFCRVPSQAIPCFLDGLHNYDFAMTNPKINEAVNQMILGRSFASQLSSRDPIHLTLYDTENDEEDIDMNAALKLLVDQSFTSPDMFKAGILTEIQVMTVDRNGQVFIQIPSWTLDFLYEKIALISNGFYEVSYLSSVKDISQDEIYFWSNGPTRVKVLNVLPNDELEVDFIDTGGQNSVNLHELYRIEPLNDLLPKIPPQAISVLLHGVNDGTLKTSQVQSFLDMVNSNSESPTIGKLVSFVDGVPQIEIFVRNETSHLLISVNSNLSLYETIFCGPSHISIDDQCSNDAASVFSHAEGIFLKGSIIPKIGEDLEIYVTVVENPLNFTVTPVSYLKHLNQLVDEMIIFYSSTSTKGSYKPRNGECVAAISDGSWFRVQIDGRIVADTYFGQYLDHGNMDTFHITNLRSLPNKFKKLPYLAFRAQLHGIKPVNDDWNEEDCLALKDMIHEKKFYANLKDIIYDADGIKLSLEIVDTSTPNDVYISRQLVMQKRALHI